MNNEIDEFNRGKELILNWQPEKELELDYMQGIKLKS